jgi:hypothetical protein
VALNEPLLLKAMGAKHKSRFAALSAVLVAAIKKLKKLPVGL